MKQIFGLIALLLVLGGVATRLTAPNRASDVPVLHWATDANPARIEQIRLYHEWLVANGYTNRFGRPFVKLELDVVSGDAQKLVVQGVSGVAADIMDRGVPDLESYGLLADLTADAGRLGFDIGRTYPALADSLVVNGRQYGFPCNVSGIEFWVNADTFAKLGLPLPPRTWDADTFEAAGKAFVAKANPPGGRRTAFFCNALTDWFGAMVITVMHRSQGLAVFNETLTASTLDDARYAAALERVRKWTYDDHILPTASDEASVAAQAGYGGAQLALFQNGNYGMITIGRWCLIRIREFEHPPRLAISQLPCEAFTNSVIFSRAAGVYAGSPHRAEAMTFLAFLAGDSYNRHIVDSADSLPPDPRHTLTAAFLEPPGHANEWGVHAAVAEPARTTAIPLERSPFVDGGAVDRIMKDAQDKLMAGMAGPRAVAAEASQRINAEVALNLHESAALRRLHDQRRALQAQIDARRREGRPVPLDWISNPFHRRYYAAQGWLEVSAGEHATRVTADARPTEEPK